MILVKIGISFPRSIEKIIGMMLIKTSLSAKTNLRTVLTWKRPIPLKKCIGHWGTVTGKSNTGMLASGLSLWIVFVFVTVGAISGQETVSTPADATATSANPAGEPNSLDAAKKKMGEHLKKIARVITLFRLSEDEDADEQLRSEFQQLLIDGRAIASELQRQIVMDARQSSGSDKEEKSRFIYDLFFQNSEYDRYENNWELAQYLIDIGFEDKKQEIYAVLGRNALVLNDYANAKKFYEKAVSLRVFPEKEQKVGVVLPDAIVKWPAEEEARRKDAEKGDLPRVVFETTKGRFVIELFEDEAPKTVGNFIHLVEKGFYNELLFHRVEQHLVVQTGCPNGDGTGGPGYSIQAENGLPNSRNHFRGSVGMALAGDQADSGGSQFYICMSPLNFLDGRFTVFGRVIEGMDTVEHLNRVNLSEKSEENERKLVPDRVLDAKVLRKRAHDYLPTYSSPPKKEG
jgi:cyclophilin family peptidyl-prolyl cis-trans isomerase